MFGLLRKDYHVMKKNLIYALCMVTFFGVIWIPQDMGGALIPVAMLSGMIQTISLFAYDEKSGWDAYALTMPVSRTVMVIEKYVVMLAGALAGGFYSLLLNLLLPSKDGAQLFSMIPIVLGGICMVALYGSIILPLIIHLGAEKSRMVIFFVSLVPAILIIILLKTQSKPDGETLRRWMEIGKVVLPAVCAALLCLSALISVRIYRKKEF